MSGTDRTDAGLPRRAVLRGAAATAGLAVVGTSTASAQETVTYGDWFTDAAAGGNVDNYDGTTVDERGSDAITIQVGSEGNGGPFAFGPAAVQIDPGTTVTFEWVSDTHNTIIEEAPEGTAWEGHQPIENTGFSYEHTFETEGLYKYYCEPHLPLGMKAAIVVGDFEIAAPADGEAGTPWTWPGGEAGAAFVALLLGTAGLAVLVIFGGDGATAVKNWRQTTREAAAEPLTESEPDRGVVRELGHDEFDPFGTASLIVIYFLILVALWVFVYFVEFLNNGPTVIG